MKFCPSALASIQLCLSLRVTLLALLLLYFPCLCNVCSNMGLDWHLLKEWMSTDTEAHHEHSREVQAHKKPIHPIHSPDVYFSHLSTWVQFLWIPTFQLSLQNDTSRMGLRPWPNSMDILTGLAVLSLPQNSYFSKMHPIPKHGLWASLGRRMDFTGMVTLPCQGSKFEAELELSQSWSCNEHWQKCDLSSRIKAWSFLAIKLLLQKKILMESSVKNQSLKDFNSSWTIWWFHGWRRHLFSNMYGESHLKMFEKRQDIFPISQSCWPLPFLCGRAEKLQKVQ